MSDSSEPPTWGFYVYYGMSIVTLPVYFVILICLLRLRRTTSKVYKTTFYSLLLQHCIADLFSMLGYIALSPARAIPQVRQFYFDYQQYYIAAAANWKIIIVYWILPTLLSIVVLKDTNFHFDGLEDMAIVAEKTVIQRNTLMALIVVGITCIVSSLAYGILFVFVRTHSSKLNKTLRREIHLAFQVLVLLLAFFAILVFYAFLNYFSQTQNNGPVFYMRGLYPMANGFLSYMNPFCILFLNKDLTHQVFELIICHQVSSVSELSDLSIN
ncbi:CBN-SRV-27 protein [Caenorhabditis brenneri]|uniref:CBN-SRV-27 protein n=1 Tax=Caenorhabditis brenneri TaxID=135651 RepID=G0N9Z3_CAEBE|nr:CBN-SRV-27 protein [Caenorhabditis brenneri]